VASAFTTYTERSVPRMISAFCGITIAPRIVRKVMRTVTYWPGHKRCAAFGTSPLTRMVPVVVSTALSTNVMRPSMSSPLSERVRSALGSDTAMVPPAAAADAGADAGARASRRGCGAVGVTLCCKPLARSTAPSCASGNVKLTPIGSI
jgi:hypothetical protein